MPSHAPAKINSPKFAFYYLLSLVALIFSSLAVGQIAFQYINKFMPDIFGQIGLDFSPDVLKFAVSAIIIAAPIFFIVTNLIYKSLVSGKMDKDSGVRRWLTYFILFVAAVIIIGCLIGTVNNFLNGNWTAKFLLQMLTVIGIAAVIFSFYLYDIRRKVVDKPADRVLRVYFWGALALMIIAFVASLFIVESPQAARNRLIDGQIINDFSSVQANVSNYYSTFKKLPATLNDVREQYNVVEIYRDPVTLKDFGYELKDTSTYALCADFRTDNKNNRDASNEYVDETMRHIAGYQCLEFKVYPENIKVVPAVNGSQPVTTPAAGQTVPVTPIQ